MPSMVILHPGKDVTVKGGHPWIYPKAIAKIKGTPHNGELISVLDANHNLLALGAYNENSLYRVRVLLQAFEKVNHDLKSIIEHRLKQANTLRTLLNLPNDTTNAYRLFNSEADGLSGLTVDCFNQHLVISSSAYWVEANRAIIQELIHELNPEKKQIWISQHKLLAKEGFHGELGMGSQEQTVVKEAGVQLNVQFENAQKTGLFLDQRENHQRLAALAKGKTVLDLYTYSGGFALHAALGGAKAVTAVDSSAQAIEQAKSNQTLNQLNTIHFVQADARDYLAKAGDFDIVILDPPKLVPSRAHLAKAKNYYRFLHREVFKAMKPGSLLITCNCSSALSANAFTDLVETQAREVACTTRILGVYGPSSCHPTLAAFPEGHYLTAVFMAIV